MGLLWKRRDVAFTAARDALGLTDGNLASHADRLVRAGFLDARRALAGDRFEVRYRITSAGREAFREYLRAMQAFLEATGDGQDTGTEGQTAAP